MIVKHSLLNLKNTKTTKESIKCKDCNFQSLGFEENI